jgi:DNA-binding transcriptional MocR family regulator
VIDLSGTGPAWPVAAREIWQDCLLRATAAASAWTSLDYQGDPLLREAIGRRQGLRPEHLTITAGVRAAALTYGRRESLILLERPGFDGVRYALSGAAGKVEQRTWAQLLDVEPPPGAAIWLTSPARNPDGISLSAHDRQRLTDWSGRGHRIVVNGAYGWFAPDTPHVAGADLLGSFHKVAGRGARLGWVYSERFFAEAVPEIAGTTPPPAWQRAWGLFCVEGGLDLIADATVDGTRAALAAFHGELRCLLGRDVAYADGPNRLLPLAEGIDDTTALATLRERGFALTSGVHFAAPWPGLRATFTDVAPDEAAAFARMACDRRLFRDPDGWPVPQHRTEAV